MKAPPGFSARLADENLGLTLSDGINEEKIWASALEFAEALARLEEHPLHDEYDFPLEFQSPEPEATALDASLPGMARVAYPAAEESYTAAQLELFDPPGLLLLRKIVGEGENLLELTTPQGSVFVFDYEQVHNYLRPLLPR